jgi:hypothetical protein
MTRPYLVHLHCTDCGHTYKRKLKSLDSPDPPCPKCRKKEFSAGFDVAGKAPHYGGSIGVKAIDETAKIVMEDYKLTDLKDNVRVGDSMVPRLDPARQSMADGMFAKNRKGSMMGLNLSTGRPQPISGGMNMGNIVRSAMSGAYKDPASDPIAVVQSRKQRPPIHIVNQGVKK